MLVSNIKEYDVQIVQSEYFTLKEVAERLKVSERTVWRWVHSGELPAIKLGQQWRIRDDDLDEFLEARRAPRKPSQEQEGRDV